MKYSEHTIFFSPSIRLPFGKFAAENTESVVDKHRNMNVEWNDFAIAVSLPSVAALIEQKKLNEQMEMEAYNVVSLNFAVIERFTIISCKVRC